MVHAHTSSGTELRERCRYHALPSPKSMPSRTKALWEQCDCDNHVLLRPRAMAIMVDSRCQGSYGFCLARLPQAMGLAVLLLLVCSVQICYCAPCDHKAGNRLAHDMVEEEKVEMRGREGRIYNYNIIQYDDFPNLEKVAASSRRDLQERISGGRPLPRTLRPFQVLVDISFPDFFQLCGGTLVHPEYVVTAANCLVAPDFPDVRPPADILIRVGSSGIERGQIVNIVKVWSHPGFDLNWNGTFANDIALLKLARALPVSDTVIPIKLAYDDRALGPLSDISISGWGTDVIGGNVSSVLLGATVDHLPNRCGRYGSSFKPQVMICAGCSNGGVDSCQGDNGGPATTSSSSGGCPVVVGLPSFGARCADPEFPGVYARASALLGWLESSAGLSFSSQYSILPTKNCQTCAGPQQSACGLTPLFDVNRCKWEAWISFSFKFYLRPCVRRSTGQRRTISEASLQAFFRPASLKSFKPDGDVFFLQGLPGGFSKLRIVGVQVRVPLRDRISSRQASLHPTRGAWTALWPSDRKFPDMACSSYYTYVAVFISRDRKLVQVSHPSKYTV